VTSSDFAFGSFLKRVSHSPNKTVLGIFHLEKSGVTMKRNPQFSGPPAGLVAQQRKASPTLTGWCPTLSSFEI